MELTQSQLTLLRRWRLSTFMVMLFGYVGYYMIRQNLPAAFPLMEKTFGYTNAQLGLIAASSEIVYAIGKFLNGPLADKLGGKKIFLIGMAGGIVANLLFAFGSSLIWFIGIWCICRYFLSMGWGGVAKTIGAWYEPEKNGTVMGWISLNFQFGGVVATLFAGWLVQQGQSWDKLFLYPAILVCAVWVWSLLASKSEPGEVIPGATFGHNDSAKTSVANFEHSAEVHTKEIIRGLMSLPVFHQLLLFAFLTTFLRSIFIFWTPKFLVDIGMQDSTAIFQSALLPFLGCIGTVLLGWYTDTYAPNGDRAKAMWIMLVGLLLALVGIALIADKGPQFHYQIVILLGLSGFFLLGPYSMSAGCLTLDIAGPKGAGTCAGIVDGVGYIGGALATWGAGSLSDALGWSQVFWVLAGCALFSIFSAYVMSGQFRAMAAQQSAD